MGKGRTREIVQLPALFDMKDGSSDVSFSLQAKERKAEACRCTATKEVPGLKQKTRRSKQLLMMTWKMEP